MENQEFIIAGGGIAGLTTAIALQRIGIRASVYEAAPRLEAEGAGLVLASNAMQGYNVLGMGEKVAARGYPLQIFTILDQQGETIRRTDTTLLTEQFGAPNIAIHRAELQQVLLEELPEAMITTGKRAVRFSNAVDRIQLIFNDGSSVEGDYLIAADGIHSPIRRQILPRSKPRYAGYTCWRAVIDNPMPGMAYSTESWGKGRRFGIVPLADNKLYWFATLDAPENSRELKSYGIRDLLTVFRHFHNPVGRVIRATSDADLIWGDIYDIAPLRHYTFGRSLLVGDAAHATTPNMGQGACQAVEDAVVLANALEQTRSVPEAFQMFERKRLNRTHEIIRLSRRLGQLGQLNNPLLIGMRNGVLRMLPDGLNDSQLRKLYTVEF